MLKSSFETLRLQARGANFISFLWSFVW